MMSSKHEITVFIVEDDEAICKALEWLFKSVHLNVKTFSSGKSFLENLRSDWNGCLVVDVRMPEMSGLELQNRLNDLNIKIPIIFITGHGDIPMAVRAMKAGAFDFITKPFNNQILLEQIQKAIELGNKYSLTLEEKKFAEAFRKLTSRENEVMQHIVAGKLNKQIAAALQISISTVEMHRSNIMRKLGVNSIVELIRNYTIYEKNQI